MYLVKKNLKKLKFLIKDDIIHFIGVLMKKKLLIVIFALLGMVIYANDIKLDITITGLTENKGTVFILLQNEEDYNNKEFTMTYEDSSPVKESTIMRTINVTEGFYYISVFQDLNNNKELDENLFKIPKEPIGFSNYDFKGFPKGFDEHKVYISNEHKSVEIKVKKF